MDEKTVWREMADENYAINRQRVDWTGIPQVHDYMAELMTGRRQDQRGGWVLHTLDKHLTPLVQSGRAQYQDGVSFVTFGCGPALIEKALIENGWPIKKIVCREYDAALRHAAEANLTDFPIEKSFEFFDFNDPKGPEGEKFDVAFFSGSLHHCENLEGFLPYLNSLLGPNSLVIGVDYFGPPRLQVEHETKFILQELFSCLPEHLRYNLTKGHVDQVFQGQTIAEVRTYDPTEAPRSSDLRSLLFTTFEVVEKLPLGGTLLRHILANRAGNYRSAEDFAILSLLMFIERELIRSYKVQSDHVYFVLRRTDRL